MLLEISSLNCSQCLQPSLVYVNYKLFKPQKWRNLEINFQSILQKEFKVVTYKQQVEAI